MALYDPFEFVELNAIEFVDIEFDKFERSELCMGT